MQILSTSKGATPLRLSCKQVNEDHNLNTCTGSNATGSYSLIYKNDNNFRLWNCDIRTKKEPIQIMLLNEQPAIVLLLSLVGSFHIQLHTLASILLHEKSFLLYYIPSFIHTLKLEAKTSYSLFILFISSNYLKSIKQQYPTLNTFLQSVRHNVPATCVPFPLIADHNIYQLIEDTTQCQVKRLTPTCKIIVQDCLNIIEKEKSKRYKQVTLKIADTTYKVKQYIHNNSTNKKLTLPIISKRTNTTPYQLNKYFSKVYNLTPSEYLNTVRMYNSLPILQNTNRTMADIADAIGFQNTRTYNRVFKKYLKMTPKHYRQMRHYF